MSWTPYEIKFTYQFTRNGSGHKINCIFTRKNINEPIEETGGLCPLHIYCITDNLNFDTNASDINLLHTDMTHADMSKFDRTDTNIFQTISEKPNALLCLKGSIIMGANVDKGTPQGFTPLMLAVQYNRKHLIIELLKSGAIPDIGLPNGQTPLILAAGLGHHEIVELLLKGGARAWVSNNDGNDPLMNASYYGKTKCAQLLLPRSNLNATNKDGRTALMIAKIEGNSEIVKLFGKFSRDGTLVSKVLLSQ